MLYLYSDSYKSDILQLNAWAINSNCLSVGELFPFSKSLRVLFPSPVLKESSLNEMRLVFLTLRNNSSNLQNLHTNIQKYHFTIFLLISMVMLYENINLSGNYEHFAILF